MDVISSLLSNPIIGMTGCILSFVSSIIAITQFLGKNKAKEEVKTLKVKIKNLQATTVNKNKIIQGDKSQYFQDNSGPVIIDNRG